MTAVSSGKPWAAGKAGCRAATKADRRVSPKAVWTVALMALSSAAYLVVPLVVYSVGWRDTLTAA
jgi:hypothetical protein